MTEFNNIIIQFENLTKKYNLFNDNKITDINDINNKLIQLNNKYNNNTTIVLNPIDQLIESLNNQNFVIDPILEIILNNMPTESIENKKIAINKINNILVSKLEQLIQLYKK